MPARRSPHPKPLAFRTNGEIDVSPREARYDPSRLARLEAHLGEWIDSGRLQGASFLMARRGQVFAHRALGRLTHRPDSAPLRPDAINRVASVSKLFTATAVMKLVEQGRIWLDQPVKELVRELDNSMHGEIRVRHLLTHTSGLPADPGFFGEPFPMDVWPMFDREDWLLAAVLAGPGQSRPGERWAYSTRGSLLLAEMVRRVTGEHFNDFVQEEIFRPLGMTRSFFEVPEPLWPEVCLRGDWEPEKVARANARKGAPGGGDGAYSTLHDLFKFGQCFLQGGERRGAKILGRKSVEEMARNQLSRVPGQYWGQSIAEMRHGLGWVREADGSTAGPEVYYHEGWGWSGLFVDPVEQFILVYFVIDQGPRRPELLVTARTIAFSGIL